MSLTHWKTLPAVQHSYDDHIGFKSLEVAQLAYCSFRVFSRHSPPGYAIPLLLTPLTYPYDSSPCFKCDALGLTPVFQTHPVTAVMSKLSFLPVKGCWHCSVPKKASSHVTRFVVLCLLPNVINAICDLLPKELQLIQEKHLKGSEISSSKNTVLFLTASAPSSSFHQPKSLFQPRLLPWHFGLLH